MNGLTDFEKMLWAEVKAIHEKLDEIKENHNALKIKVWSIMGALSILMLILNIWGKLPS